MSLSPNIVKPTTFLSPEKLITAFGLDLTIASETFQHTGSFKFRAAYNLANKVSNEHIITSSSGNFGQALAYACKIFGKRCHVVMPNTSARVKVEAVENYGATAVLTDVKLCGREERVNQLIEEFPEAYRASPYDDPYVIEGNATLGAEIAAFDSDFDYIVVPIGGGGLISGILKGIKDSGSKAIVIGAEPALANDAARSLKAGELVKNESEPQTIADGARTLSLGKRNWAIIKDELSEIIQVPDDAIKSALQSYFVLANLKVEPTGAVSLGAILTEAEKFNNKKTCVIVSGGNVDAAVFAALIK
ncbi:MAG: threonine/serine dehydratase [Pyrinomonadaceae bacterium]